MKPGIKPKPEELKRKQGTLRAKPTSSIPNVGVFPLVIPDAPLEYSPDSLDLWARVWTSGALWLKPEADREIVLRYCDLIAERKSIRTRLDTEGELSEGYNGQPRPHPLLNRLGVIDRTLMALEDRLGLNPSERGRMGHTEIKAKSKLEQLMEDRQRKQG
jgi:P27 family predicted phage terminase small subunit